ncbi:MAG TPA: molybdopterin oxidoreductase family protein [Alphaproteobacteria bacterium]|nr:molybdopterin oxidoreductase family protein [Alphaproteobacteria bacterium]
MPGAEGLWSRLFGGEERADTSPVVHDEIRHTTCYMCACRCGIRVHMLDGAIRFIDGNPNHPVNRGVLCAKGSAGIMNHYSPARLSRPLLRVGPRGSGEFKEITWDEALDVATKWLAAVRRENPRKLAFFTGRDQSQALTGWWAAQFGTPNYAAHGGFCSVNMAAAGLYTVGGSFWEFGEPDWERTRYFMMFGVAEDHDSNPIKTGIAQLKARGAKFVSVNPIRTGYSAVADEWLAITPGTDGLFIFALIHELLRADKIDLDYLVRYTNAPWLVIRDPGAADDGLFARGDDGRPVVWDRQRNGPVDASDTGASPKIAGEVRMPDGRMALPAFHLFAERMLDAQYAPEAVAPTCGVPAATIRRIAAELAHAAFDEELVLERPWTDWAGRHHARTIGRPVAMHAMRGISAHSNGFHTCRALHLLQMLLGSIDTPGGWRYKSPYPRPAPPPIRPAGHADHVAPDRPLAGPPLGFPMGPEDLLIDEAGAPLRIDKAYSWDAPLAAHGLMHTVIANAARGDPYPIDTLFMFMANMAWNSAMNTGDTLAMLAATDPASGEYRIPRIIYADAYASEMVAYADLVLPDTTYLERWDCLSLLDRPIGSADGPADAIRQPVIRPDRDVRPFQDVLIELGARLKLPGFVTAEGAPKYPGLYADYIANHERRPGIGSLAGWRGPSGDQDGIGAPNPHQLARYVANECFWRYELPEDARFFKHANKAYLEHATTFGFIDKPEPIVLQLYCEPLQRFRLAARGHGPIRPPERHRARIETYFDPLPIWYPPLEAQTGAAAPFALHAISQRPMAMYHSWGSHNPWLRQIHGANRLYMHRATAASLGLQDDDWAWIESANGRVKAQVRLMDGVNRDTVWTWNAVAKRAGAWNLDRRSPEVTRGFLLNHLVAELLPERDGYRYSNSDPVTGQAAWYDLRVRVAKADPVEAGASEPQYPPMKRPPGLVDPPSILRYGGSFGRRSEGGP